MLERYRKSELHKKKDARNYERHLDFWIEQVGDTTISGLTRARIIEIRDQMASKKSAATVNRYLATFRHAFNIAVTDWEWASKNPLQRIKLSEPRGRDRHLADDEIKALLKATSESDHPHLHAIVLIALTTGARRGEIMGLSWQDVDLSAGRAVLHKTKNTDKRALVLVPQVVEALRAIQRVRRIDSDVIFGNPNPAGKRTYGHIEAAWREARDKAELEDFRFHDLRHTFASRMAMNGKTLREIAEALGHRTLAMVQRYSHLTDSHVQTAMEETALRILGDE
jgi:integrase